MAKVRVGRKPIKDTIDKFFGLNLTGETQLKKGESPNMNNCYITDNYDLDKMYGYGQMMKAVGSYPIRGQWHGILNGTSHFLFACNGHIYKVTNGYWDDDSTWESTNAFTTHCIDLGTLTDATTRFFDFGGKVYLLNGFEYKSWDGVASTFIDVVGYAPLMAIGCKPSTGTGTPFEVMNQLTGQKHITYNGDTTAVYQLPETNIASVDSVTAGGVLKTVTTHYTVDLTNGKVTFTSGNEPIVGLTNVDIYWTKENNDRTVVTKNRAFVEFKNRIFMYGSSTKPNEFLFSTLANRIPSAEYFPVLNVGVAGKSNSAITDITNGYDRLVITKPNSSYFALYDSYTTDGIEVVNFPVYDLNDTTGNVAFAQGQVVDNYPVTLEKGIQQWIRTDSKDEKNAVDISLRIKDELNDIDLSTALTVDFQERNEYWLIVGTTLYIYNYGLYGYENDKQVKGLFSRVTLKDTPTCISDINGEIYFGTETGMIMKFSPVFLTFNGQTINEHWENGFDDYGANYLTKTLDKVWIGLQPQSKSIADINFITNVKSGETPATIKHQRQVFMLGDVDFSDFSFAISSNPQPKFIKIKAKKFTYLKITIDNNSATETCKILNITTNINFGGESK